MSGTYSNVNGQLVVKIDDVYTEYTFDTNTGNDNSGSGTSTGITLDYNLGADDVDSSFAYGGLGAAPSSQADGQSTAQVLELIKAADDQTWAGMTLIDEADGSHLIDGSQVISMRVWSAKAGSISLEAANGESDFGQGATVKIVVTESLVAGWNDLSFDFAGQNAVPAGISASSTLDKLSVFPDNGSVPTQGEWVYKIDSVTIPAPKIVASPVPASTTASHQSGDELIFIDTGSTAANLDTPIWGQAGTASVVDSSSTGQLIKISGLNYQGITFDSLDVADKTSMHIDVYSETSGSVKLFFI
jgi:hypothetical protein